MASASDSRGNGSSLRQPILRDELTDLPSRALLQEHALQALARARAEDRSVAMLHLGLDDFKLVNDSFGHTAGDEVLRRIGARLREHVRDTSLVARPGGDEFCVLVPDLDADPDQVIEFVVGQVMVAVEEPLSVSGSQFQLGASIGVSVFPRDASDVEGLLKHADAAMYEAKNGGRGTFVVYAGGTQEALERLVMTRRLREALEQRDFVLHYQPIVDLASGEIVAVEALLRWRDRRRGLIPPLDFIPVAEYTGLIEPIGAWVVDAACAQARRWRDEGDELPVSVNASPRQFQSPGFAAMLRERLDVHGLDPACLSIEITESTAMRDPACVEPVLQQLSDAGIRIAIDDFGTGYSSLSRLQQMPVEVVKLDRTFLQDVPANGESARMAAATIELVRALNKTVVAEGVETEEQRRFLADHGCSRAQGFHLGPPVPASEIRPLVRRRARA